MEQLQAGTTGTSLHILGMNENQGLLRKRSMHLQRIRCFESRRQLAQPLRNHLFLLPLRGIASAYLQNARRVGTAPQNHLLLLWTVLLVVY